MTTSQKKKKISKTKTMLQLRKNH